MLLVKEDITRLRIYTQSPTGGQWLAHFLCFQADAALKEEVAKSRALAELCDADVAYLRGVIVSGLESGSLPREGPMFVVLTRLLKVTPQVGGFTQFMCTQ